MNGYQVPKMQKKKYLILFCILFSMWTETVKLQKQQKVAYFLFRFDFAVNINVDGYHQATKNEKKSFLIFILLYLCHHLF